MSSKTLVFLFIIWLGNPLAGQDIMIPDTVCVGVPLEMAYSQNSQDACLSNYISFLDFERITEPVAQYPESEVPLFSHFVKDNLGNYFGFATNFMNSNIVRLEFGPSLLNNPEVQVFSLAEVTSGVEGIQILYDEGEWWGFVNGNQVAGGDEFLIRLSFGTSLSNTPVEENLGVVEDAVFPHDLFFFKEQENWIGLMLNKWSNSLTRFNFGERLSNTPVVTNLGNIGDTFHPTGFFPIESDGEWHLFIANSKEHSLTRLDFDTALTNMPTGTNLGAFDILERPRDLIVTKICNNYIGLVLNRIGNELVLLEFGENIKSVPTATSLGTISDFSFPHSISNLHFTEEGILFFVCNVDSKELVESYISTRKILPMIATKASLILR